MGNGSVGALAAVGSPTDRQDNSVGRCSDRRRCFDSTSSNKVCRSIRTSAGRSCAGPRSRELYLPMRWKS